MRARSQICDYEYSCPCNCTKSTQAVGFVCGNDVSLEATHLSQIYARYGHRASYFMSLCQMLHFIHWNTVLILYGKAL